MLLILCLFGGVLAHNTVISSDGVAHRIDGFTPVFSLTQDVGTVLVDSLNDSLRFENNSAGGMRQLMIVDTATSAINFLHHVDVVNNVGDGLFTTIILGRLQLSSETRCTDHAQLICGLQLPLPLVLDAFRGYDYGSVRDIPGFRQLESGDYLRLPFGHWTYDFLFFIEALQGMYLL